MEMKLYFSDFLKDIRLTENQVQDLKNGHNRLRERLLADDDLSSVIVNTFLQGSYRRATAVRSNKNGNKSDVDVIVVTNLDKNDYPPQKALDLFLPFLEKHYGGKYKMQGRSIGIELSSVELDLVITSAPSETQKEIWETESILKSFALDEVENWSLSESQSMKSQQAADAPAWKTEPLLIPDRDAGVWEKTDPLAQIQWTWNKNAKCYGHYVNVVKALKWWKKLNPDPKYPKGYPLEHLIGTCCPDNIESVAQGVTFTLENIVLNHPTKPILEDHGVPEHDVFARITEAEYKEFYDLVKSAASIAREALDSENKVQSIELWGKLFGSKFPSPPKGQKSQSGFTSRTEPTESVSGGRFG